MDFFKLSQDVIQKLYDINFPLESTDGKAGLLNFFPVKKLFLDFGKRFIGYECTFLEKGVYQCAEAWDKNKIFYFLTSSENPWMAFGNKDSLYSSHISCELSSKSFFCQGYVIDKKKYELKGNHQSWEECYTPVGNGENFCEKNDKNLKLLNFFMDNKAEAAIKELNALEVSKFINENPKSDTVHLLNKINKSVNPSFRELYITYSLDFARSISVLCLLSRVKRMIQGDRSKSMMAQTLISLITSLFFICIDESTFKR